MIPFDVMIVFIGVAFALAAVPGPDNIFVLMQSAMHGRQAGLFVTCGLASGLVFHTTAVALGVAIIFQTSQYAFSVLKFIGVVYLCYLAWGAFRAGQSHFDGEPTPPEPNHKLYLRGLIMNIANPKITIFFLAFLPQFVDAAHGSIIVQFYILGAAMMGTTLITFGLIAISAGTLGDWVKSAPRAQKWLNWASGVIFLGLALKLITTQK